LHWTASELTIAPAFDVCRDCADFESAILHEIGHFLGLGHPDNIPLNLHPDADVWNPVVAGNNTYNSFLAEGNRTDSVVCDWLWNFTEHGIPPNWPANDTDIGSQNYPIRNSVMEAFTQHNPKPCLLWDDVEALSVLYPDCSDASISAVTCHKVNHNIGLVRTTIYVIFPLFLALICLMALTAVIHWYQKDELETARRNQEKLEQKVQELEKKLSVGGGARKRGKSGKFPGVETASSSDLQAEP
jgi:hypothetical protein